MNTIPVTAILGLAKALVDHIPTPDPELRAKRLEARLERQRMRLEAKLKKEEHDYKDIDADPWKSRTGV